MSHWGPTGKPVAGKAGDRGGQSGGGEARVSSRETPACLFILQTPVIPLLFKKLYTISFERSNSYYQCLFHWDRSPALSIMLQALHILGWILGRQHQGRALLG